MFEIRVICENTDVGTLTTALLKSFKLSDVHRRTTHGGRRVRLYATAEPRPTPAEWPTPEQAYTNATDLVAETTRLTVTAADPETELDREWYLRHAALLDRVALHIAGFDNDPGADKAAEEAEATAAILLDLDQAPRDHDPRAYVRQQYALWASGK